MQNGGKSCCRFDGGLDLTYIFLMNYRIIAGIAVLAMHCSGPSQTRPDSLHPAAQNPSPMVESTREHRRIQDEHLAGLRFTIPSLLPKPVEVFVPQKYQPSDSFCLLIHFLGPAYIVENASQEFPAPIVAATISLGAGSSIFDRPFRDTSLFAVLVDSIQQRCREQLGHPCVFQRIYLSGFSAGYGAIRRIISTPENYRRVDGILLLDGIHASYVPEGRALADGGTIDSTHIHAFLDFAAEAAKPDSKKQFLITHSEIFPGTFVSTTEATDAILRTLGMRRKAVLMWGPLGMQQTSEAGSGRFLVLGFAGNSAQDHVDHLHALGEFLRKMEKL